MYVTYFDEGGKCFLMEYYVKPDYRGLGYGKLAYFKAERYINEEGALYIELTPTNESNERFWTSIGFNKSNDLDGDLVRGLIRKILRDIEISVEEYEDIRKNI